MKLFRYRRPSLRTLTGLTTIKRSIRKASGISTFERYTKPSRIKQRIKQQVGIYSPAVTPIRQSLRGRLPSLFGLFKNK